MSLSAHNDKNKLFEINFTIFSINIQRHSQLPPNFRSYLQSSEIYKSNLIMKNTKNYINYKFLNICSVIVKRLL